jgi:TolA-binding protein
MLAGLLTEPMARAAAGSAESRAFDAAKLSFDQTFWDLAEKNFADFVQKYPTSAHLPEAFLLQAVSRVHLTNYAGAIELLSAHQTEAGPRADDYLFWLAQAEQGKGDYSAAADSFAVLLKRYPASALGLEAAVGECAARAKLADWTRVRELLQQTNGVFQVAVRGKATNEVVARGYLLLGEADLAQKDFVGAEAAVQALGGMPLSPTLDWERQYLLCRTVMAAGRANEAVQDAATLVNLAKASGQRGLLAQSISLQAGFFEQLGRAMDAIAAYTNNLVPAVPADYQRQAVSRITSLCQAQNQPDLAAQILDQFTAQFTNAPAADLALLRLGELRLGQFRDGLGTNPPPAILTNAPGWTNLQSAKVALSNLLRRFPQGPLLGQAQRGLGWCFWFENKLPDSLVAFQAAVDQLPLSPEQADAQFKLGDVQFQLKNFAAALTNYVAVTERYGSLPQVRTNLLEPALCQTVQAGLSASNFGAVDHALTNLLAQFPTSLDTERAVLSVGRDLGLQGEPARAREVVLDYLKGAPHAQLEGELKLAVATTYEQEGQWSKAITQYNDWLATYTNHEARPHAEYSRAYAEFHAGEVTNAFGHLTNFLADFPAHELTALAQYKVADFYFYWYRDPLKAEENYQLVAKNKAAPPAMVYEAQMMAGRAAVARQGWKDAQRYFSNLASDANCPPGVRAQAMFAYGDTLVSLLDSGETNKLANYTQAIEAFDLIPRLFPTNRLALLALGAKANCLLQWARVSGRYDTNAFEQVITSTNADGVAWSIAKVGAGVTLEKLAEEKSGDEQLGLLKQALQSYLDVLNEKFPRDDQKADPYWTARAGREAARLAEALQEWSGAVKVYERLETLLPELKNSFEKRKLKAQENLAKATE